MHYDVFELVYGDPHFIASCAKENDAVYLAESMAIRASDKRFEYKVRARPTVEHTIWSFNGADYDDSDVIEGE